MTKGGKPGKWCDHWKDLDSSEQDGRKDKTESKEPNHMKQSWVDLLVYVLIVTWFITDDY